MDESSCNLDRGLSGVMEIRAGELTWKGMPGAGQDPTFAKGRFRSIHRHILQRRNYLSNSYFCPLMQYILVLFKAESEKRASRAGVVRKVVAEWGDKLSGGG